jgi:cardiolipin synthase C
VFIGSMNLDPRSKLLNTEMGVLVDCPALAEEVVRFFEKAADSRSAFHVQLAKTGGLTWSWDEHGNLITSSRDPQVRPSRKLEFEVLRVLPIRGLL